MKKRRRHVPAMAGYEPTLYELLNARLLQLPVRFRGSSDGLAPGLLSTLPNTAGYGDATAAGSLRPTVVGDEIVFAGAQRMVTPAFSMGARSSGFVVFRASAMNQGAFQFGAVNAHHSALVTASLTRLRRNSGGAELTGAWVAGARTVLAWSVGAFGTQSGFVDGVAAGVSAGAPGTMNALTAALSIGDLTAGILPLNGAICELCIVDAVVSADDLALMSSAVIERWM